MNRLRSRAGAVLAAALLAVLVAPSVAHAAVPLPYPDRGDYRIKAIQPDFWPNQDEIAGNNTGGVAMNLVWAAWEGQVTAAPCADGQQEYDAHCFTVPADVDSAIHDWTARGLVVTGVLYGTPSWALGGKPCSAASGPQFCTPADPADFARFAGMIAQRYDGLHGHGRVADFVVQNEVNTHDWFDYGCGANAPCDTNRWLDEIGALYDGAYDRVVAEQPYAKVLISLDHQFGQEVEHTGGPAPVLAGTTVLRGLAARAGGRAWRVAMHPYPNPLRSAVFGPDDYPYVTYGDVGILLGWLHATFPGTPSAWDVQLTESGINSLSPSSPQTQANAICTAFRNVLGTPGISNYVYHRMTDHPVEVAAGLALGLHDTQGAAKPAWATWALANRNDLNPPQLSCGFETLPYTTVTRGYSGSRGHWASSRALPAGFAVEKRWHFYREQVPGTIALYECKVNTHNLLTQDPGCEGGLLPLGPVGFLYTSPQPGTGPVFRCRIAGDDHFISPSADCEGQTTEHLLGYAFPA
ncbi:DUF5722 domain-containing protein [Amycolatopsis sp. NBC_01488]|uniref:DUF5722 domain-containing protein n=1 Tax=Amycolatopsis sp. NBC_01488 TaxID=2903563 RepID=UPI002E29C047|nr:DUF5722 domain-containing protein [Amycolatopsis sp. NBC_01488]